ncbi:hypothetical protein D3C73_1612320 [compost metagenome]
MDVDANYHIHQLVGSYRVTGSGNTARIHVRDLTVGKKELLADLVRCGISVIKFEAGHTSLEDLFMKVVEE